jgi:hypothetical protein
MEAGLTAAKRGLLGMGEALTDFRGRRRCRQSVPGATACPHVNGEEAMLAAKEMAGLTSRGTVAQTCGLIGSLEIATASRSVS